VALAQFRGYLITYFQQLMKIMSCAEIPARSFGADHPYFAGR
jgi:hypothetical protein